MGKYMEKYIVTVIVAACVFCCGMLFWGGMTYQKARTWDNFEQTRLFKLSAGAGAIVTLEHRPKKWDQMLELARKEFVETLKLEGLR
jgi:hypothetical protein